MLAVKEWDDALIRMLLHGSADANVKDFAGDVPLFVALRKAKGTRDSHGIVRALLNANADIDATDKTGRKMLVVAMQDGASDDIIAALRDGIHAEDTIQSSSYAKAAQSTPREVRDIEHTESVACLNVAAENTAEEARDTEQRTVIPGLAGCTDGTAGENKHIKG
eukprot:GEMP01036575.1.p1 GENE.GEMP01036575.1~~GEMP01036575.1.p1  ORF type:complete len:165 (+),score=41.22 GEMP01036575.1:322-816(+)